MGLQIGLKALDTGRMGIAAQALGIAQAAFDEALRYAKERHQFGVPIAKHQAIQMMIADMATQIDAARLMVYRAAVMDNQGKPLSRVAAMAKLFSSQVAGRVASTAIDLFGGYGFTRDYPVEKLYRDAKVGAIYEGTSNMQLQTIAKMLIK